MTGNSELNMYTGLSHQKQSYPMAGIHALHGIAAIFLRKSVDAYGIIADDLRFDTQLSNVYGNAIRAKLATAQTTRSVAGLFSSFVTQNLQSICSLYHRHPRFFIDLRNPIPLQIHESPPFAMPDAKSCFCFPCLWQSKRKKPNFLQRTALGV